jgi:hypothetical protein
MKLTVAFALIALATMTSISHVSAGAPLPLGASPVATVTSASNAGSNTWSVGADGWTVFNGSPGTGTCGNSSSNYTGTCVVYVANAGNDANCAAQPLPLTSTPAHPCATPGKAQTLMRNNHPDWLLLKRGDKWNGGLNGVNGAWFWNGRSAAEPMLISGYGAGANPLFSTNGVDTSCYSTTATRGQFMAIAAIDCYADYADPTSPTYLGVTAVGNISAASPTITGITSTKGIAVGYVAYGSGINGLIVQSVTADTVTLSGNPQFTSAQRPIQFNKRLTQAAISVIGTSNFLIIEGCTLRFGGLVIQNSVTPPVPGVNYRIRRNVILDAYGDIGRGANGVFLSDNPLTDGQILIEENVVDHSGYNTSIWGAGGNVFSHNFYLHDDNPAITFVKNITMEASATGAQVRNGGTIYNNLSVGNPIAFLSNPGIQPNATAYSYNVIADGSDIIIGIRNAIGATSVGNKVLELDGVLTSGNFNFVGNSVADLDNPGAIAGVVSSVTATSATMSVNVAAGKRGDGIKIGDRLAIYASRGQGVVVGPTGTFSPAVNSNGATYPVGSTVFFFDSAHPLPSWIVPGMNLGVYQHSSFPGGQTKVASISADRLSLRTVTASTGAIVGGEQYVFVIWTDGDQSHFPRQTVGPNNIFTTTATLGSASFAFAPQSFSQAINASGNYYYNWSIPTQNVVDYGIASANISVPNKLNVAASSSYPKATIEAYDAQTGGPGTLAHFVSEVRQQSRTRWNLTYTANAINNYIRTAIGCNCSQ